MKYRHRGQLAGASGRRRHLAFCRAAPHRDGGRAPLCGCTLEGLELHAVLRVGYRELDKYPYHASCRRVIGTSLKTVPAASASLIGVTTAGEPGCYIVENQMSRPSPLSPISPIACRGPAQRPAFWSDMHPHLASTERTFTSWDRYLPRGDARPRPRDSQYSCRRWRRRSWR